MDKLLYLLLAACVFFMNTQASIPIPIPGGKQVINLGIVDILLCVTFGLWAVATVVRRHVFRIKLPALVMIGLPAVAAAHVAIRGSESITDSAKEIFQVVEYFIVATLLFVNLGGTRTRLRGLLSVFLLAISAVVLWGVIDYMLQPDAFKASGPYGNINVLGTYLALVLPFTFGIALFDEMRIWHRVSLMVLVLVGAAITLSAAALIATVAALLLVLALRSPKLLLGGLMLLLAAIVFLPLHLRPDHKNVLAGSVSVYLDNNYLLGEKSMLERAKALYGESRYHDARRLLVQLDAEKKLSAEDQKLLETLDEKVGDNEPPPTVLPSDRNGNAQPVVAMRYKCWSASLRAALARPWGTGPGTYKESVGPYYGSTLQYTYLSNQPEVFNLGFVEPDTFNQFLVTAVELGIPGLLALVWFYLWGLSRSVMLYADTHWPISRGIAAGAMASLAFFPIVAAYSGILVRGVALPLIFIICCVYILERMEKELA